MIYQPSSLIAFKEKGLRIWACPLAAAGLLQASLRYGALHPGLWPGLPYPSRSPAIGFRYP